MHEQKMLSPENYAKVQISGWKNKDKQHDLARSITDSIEKNVHGVMADSPFYSLLWDTSSDITRREQGCLMVRHLNELQTAPVQSFVKLVEVPDATAEGEEKIDS